MRSSEPMQALAARLTGLRYEGLLLRSPAAGAALWAEAGAPEALIALAADAAAPAEARFLAAELIAANGGSAPGKALAGAYAAALRDTHLPNIWGLPGELDTPPAQHLLAMGDTAAAALRPLLGDARRVRYAGSEDATVGNAAGWRVKDFAASMIAAISGGRFPANAPPALRDEAILRLDAGP
jgi:hypothetical protein